MLSIIAFRKGTNTIHYNKNAIQDVAFTVNIQK